MPSGPSENVTSHHGSISLVALDNKRDGTGTYVWKDKGIYKGQWKNDKREGSGTFKWKNSATYIGFWRDDQIIDMDVNTVTDTQERPTFGN